VALSRVMNIDKLELLLFESGDGRIENIVYLEVLQVVI